MSKEAASATTAVVPHTATAVAPFNVSQLEQMAIQVAKSKLFAVQTPEAAFTLMLIAQAEGVHPAKAMMEYDVVEGKPSLKTSAMLARFLSAGGSVEWLEASDAKVSGRFTCPRGKVMTVTWDQERVAKAGLGTKAVHQKYPLQMKRARCISEAIRALWPVTTLYTPEELGDGPLQQQPIDVTPAAVEERVEAAVAATVASHTALTENERTDHETAMNDASSLEELTTAFSTAWKHAGEAKDAAARTAFKATYDARKATLLTTTKGVEVGTAS